MSAFEDRQQAFENRFTHDQYIRFKVNSRRARLMGSWAAERLGITGDEALAYAKELVAIVVENPCNINTIRKLQSDFRSEGLEISDHRINRELERQWEIARQQVGLLAPI